MGKLEKNTLIFLDICIRCLVPESSCAGLVWKHSSSAIDISLRRLRQNFDGLGFGNLQRLGNYFKRKVAQTFFLYIQCIVLGNALSSVESFCFLHVFLTFKWTFQTWASYCWCWETHSPACWANSQNSLRVSPRSGANTNAIPWVRKHKRIIEWDFTLNCTWFYVTFFFF